MFYASIIFTFFIFFFKVLAVLRYGNQSKSMTAPQLNYGFLFVLVTLALRYNALDFSFNCLYQSICS